MKLKRILALLLACTMTACAFASCGDDDDDDKDTKSKKSAKSDDDDDDDDEEEEETTKKGGKKSSSDDDDEEDTTAAPQKSDDDLDDLANTLYKDVISVLTDMDSKGLDLPYDDVVICTFDDTLYWDEDDKTDFSVKDFNNYLDDYLDDLDGYEYLIILDADECLLACVAETASSKDVGFYCTMYDSLDDFNDDATDAGYSSMESLNDIYDVLAEMIAENEEEDTTSGGGASMDADSAESVADAVYWATYFTVAYDMDEEPDDALICSDSSKNIYDGAFDLDAFNKGFEDELKYEDGGDYVGNYEYVVVIVDQDTEFAAAATSFTSKDVAIFTYDDDWKTALDGMTLDEIIDYFK